MSDRPVYFDFVKTRLGIFQIGATEHGLVGINFPGHVKSVRKVERASGRANEILKASKQFLRCFASGQNTRYDKIPIDWSSFQNFDRRVLRTLRTIPPQATISYSELAKRANVPRAARAVGNALNRNPIPIVIPCHRVVRKDKSLGGYAGGIRWKQTLLKLENSHH